MYYSARYSHKCQLLQKIYPPKDRKCTALLTTSVRLLSFILILYYAHPPLTLADFETGLDAYTRGDYETVLKEWRPIAEQGFPAAQFTLGQIYEGGKGVPKNYQEALKWYRKAADQGHPKAQLMLGGMYFQGNGVLQDYAEAVRWYRKSADQGDSGAQVLLGFMYLEGKGILEDHVEAAKWYRQAAEQGSALGQYALAVLYQKGDGVPQDYVLSHMWSNLAAAEGNSDAGILRNALSEKMTPPEIADAQRLAREWRLKH